MRLIRYLYKDIISLGIQLSDKDNIVPLNLVLKSDVKDFTEAIILFESMDIEDIKNNVMENLSSSVSVHDVKILAPIEYPKRNIFCLGKNYLEHALEMKGKTTDLVTVPKKPIYFSKSCFPAIGPDDVITGHIGVSEKVDYEVELAVIIGKSGKNIEKSDVKNHIFGYTIINDISARDLQIDHIQWYRAKSLDGFCPMGPVILHKSALTYPPKLKIKSYVNNEIRQDGLTSDLIFDIDYIISDLSKGMTLEPGDIIITGTPAGVGMGFDPPKYLNSGDVITCEIEKIGILTNVLK